MTRWLLKGERVQAASLVPPVSKSDAQRALVIAHLLGRREPAAGLLEEPRDAWPEDLAILDRGLEALRRRQEGTWTEIDCGAGGTPFRFLVTQAAIIPGCRARFTGTPRLGERPHQPLLDALHRALGTRIEGRGQPGPLWPVEVEAGAVAQGASEFRVEAGQSSQFASSLLLGAAALCLRERRPWKVTLEGELASPGYLRLTEGWLARCGFALVHEGASIAVTTWREPARWPEVPGDWSSIGYLLLAAWRTGGEVARVGWDTDHPDRALVRILREVGLTVTEGAAAGEGTRVSGTAQKGLAATASECPDLMPTLAALACVLPGESVLRDVGILRAKESDRLAGIQELVESAGGRTALGPSSQLRITPPAAVRAHFAYESRGDHRLAMAAATLALLSGAEVELTDPECVAKSFPDFWAQLRRAGLDTHPLS